MTSPGSGPLSAEVASHRRPQQEELRDRLAAGVWLRRRALLHLAAIAAAARYDSDSAKVHWLAASPGRSGPHSSSYDPGAVSRKRTASVRKQPGSARRRKCCGRQPAINRAGCPDCFRYRSGFAGCIRPGRSSSTSRRTSCFGSTRSESRACLSSFRALQQMWKAR